MAVAVLTVAIQPRYPVDAVTVLDEYGPDVEIKKEDCINHVS